MGKSSPPNMTDKYVHIKTCTESGVSSAPFYGQDFNTSMFIKEMLFSVELWNPFIDNAVPGEAMRIQVAYDFEGSSDQEYIGFDDETELDSNKKFEERVLKNYEWKSVSFGRFWNRLRFINWNDKRFTGMKVTWNYNTSSSTKESKTQRSFLGEDLSTIFIRLANLVHVKENEEAIWKTLKNKKLLKLDEFLAYGYNIALFYDLMDKIEIALDSKTELDPLYSISDENLELAARMFTYMLAPHQDYWAKWYLMYSNYLYHATLEKTSVRNIVASIAGITEDNELNLKQVYTVKYFILNDLSKLINLTTSKDVDYITKPDSPNPNTYTPGQDNILKSEHLHKISNHPMHLVDSDGKLSPSSFIPFCGFGGKMSSMGSKIPNFDVPVCTNFTEVILFDQLCYEVDVNSQKESFSVATLKAGLTFLVDLNEDRQFQWFPKAIKKELSEVKCCSKMDTLSLQFLHFSETIFSIIEDKDQFLIYLDYLGLTIEPQHNLFRFYIFSSTETVWRGQLCSFCCEGNFSHRGLFAAC